ncbi:hypothetical protein GGI13_002723 [Coemansia sp. RSA 455]|nr:hypothetical protein GGI09_006349 [Coemansia sp. S100]KAJ2101866.1 hypothetical protein GGI16_003335 [Coemansia sp. S142-1]KAJ2253391.1 hypothetical protein GGI13_002723 [Coemansia sp. RSA 455]
MPTLSPFQLLPLHIVRMVVNHLVGNTRLLSSGVTPGTEEYKWKLLRLLWVCQNFRTVAAARFYRVNSQNIGDDYSDDKTNQDWSSRRLQKYYQSLHPQTREVHLLLSKSSVYFGQALESLSSAPFDSWNFQEIRKLKLQFYVPQWQQNEWDEQYAERASMLKRASTMSEYYDWLDEKRREIEEEDLKITPTVKANINEFVFWVKRMMPTLCEIEVEYGLVELEQDPGNDFFDTLLEPLLRLAPRMVHRTLGEKVSVKVPLDGISNLVHINMDVYNMAPIAQLARRNAATLGYLCIMTSYSQRGSVFDLIRDVEGDYVCYPRLRVLKLEKCSDLSPHRCPVYTSVVPFPILRVLSLEGRYPFDDDVLFRGNAATLESLVLKTKHDDIARIVEFGIFTPTSHPKLQCVSILYGKGYGRSRLTSHTDYLQALLSIAPNAAVRRFPCGESQPDILSLISIFSNYPNIQVLDLSDIFLPFWDTITLIKSIPLLSDLHIMTPYIIQLPANVKDKELPAYMLSNFTPMGQRFRCWHISKASGPIITSVRCVLLLALICPNFDYCVPPKDEFREYMDEFKIVINSGGFKDHAHRLQRFLLSN